MPLMVEPLVMQPGSAGYTVDGDVEDRAARPASGRLGADIIKADLTDDLDPYPRVIEVAGSRPVSCAAAAGHPTRRLRRTEALMATGAAGSCTAATLSSTRIRRR
jgi:DhnA family fructose-bisphosphate aldolase class Ia